MKTDAKINYFFILTFIIGLITGALIFSSCTKIPDAAQDPIIGNVKISIDYGFASSGNITAKGTSTYVDFYTKYVNGKILTPKTYRLWFQNILTPNSGWGYTNKWGINNLIALAPGKYIVTGTSYPVKISGSPDISGDTCYLKFNDTITVPKYDSNIMLKAQYDCALLLVDTLNIINTWMGDNGTPADSYKNTMGRGGEFYYTFIRGMYLGPKLYNLDLMLTYRNKKQIDIVLNDYNFQNSKYYYFKNTDNSYIIPQMIGN